MTDQEKIARLQNGIRVALALIRGSAIEAAITTLKDAQAAVADDRAESPAAVAHERNR